MVAPVFVVVSFMFCFSLVTGQCNTGLTPCQPVCRCLTKDSCRYQRPCGKEGCPKTWSGKYCQRQNIVQGLSGADNLGSSGYSRETFSPKHAVDGSLTTLYQSPDANRQYLWVNTGKRHVIYWMEINTQGDISGFEIHVSNSTSFTASYQCYKDETRLGAIGKYDIKCTQPVIGQYVRILLPRKAILYIYEFQIYRCGDYYFGYKCEKLCNCENRTEVCDRNTGRCVSGCPPGVTGTGCQDPCNNGFYGPGCKYKCGQCAVEPCSKTDGRCRFGCIRGFQGTTCLEPTGKASDTTKPTQTFTLGIPKPSDTTRTPASVPDVAKRSSSPALDVTIRSSQLTFPSFIESTTNEVDTGKTGKSGQPVGTEPSTDCSTFIGIAIAFGVVSVILFVLLVVAVVLLRKYRRFYSVEKRKKSQIYQLPSGFKGMETFYEQLQR